MVKARCAVMLLTFEVSSSALIKNTDRSQRLLSRRGIGPRAGQASFETRKGLIIDHGWVLNRDAEKFESALTSQPKSCDEMSVQDDSVLAAPASHGGAPRS